MVRGVAMVKRLLLMSALLAVRMELPGCGPFLPKALFTMAHAPEDAAAFERGQLGVLLPGYTRDHLIVAYRHLAGLGAAPPPAKPPQRTDALAVWLKARATVPGVRPVRSIDRIRNVETKGNFESYLNCNDDAFRTAAATLERLTRQYGQGTQVRAWTDAQDQVFANCGGGESIPPATGDAERAYQIAAAQFYARKFDDARAGFEAIANDAGSPWREIAPYLAARCLIRQEKLDDAERQLRQIANAKWREPAGRLLGWVATKRDPQRRLRALAGAIVRKDSPTLAQDAYDYHLLLDRLQKPPREDDITDWILSFQEKGTGHSLEKWRQTQSLPWLIAALKDAAELPGGNAELLAAARQVKPDSPAYATAAFHLARLSPPEAARATASAALAVKLPVAAQNLFHAVLMRRARSLDEFLDHAVRTQVATVFEGLEYEETAMSQGKPYLDGDAATVLSRRLPLRILRQVARSAKLPQPVRDNMAQAVFVRELLLAAQPPFDGVFRLLQSPGMHPFADAGPGRETKTAEIDSLRDNWWCPFGDTKTNDIFSYFRLRTAMSPGTALLYPAGDPDAAFLSAADRAEGEREWQKLRSLPPAPDWLAAQVLARAQAQPDDARLPQALHLAVRATRYGCTAESTRAFSRRAFGLLHKRFPASEWTKKTPHWY